MKFIYDFFIILAFIICQPLRLLSSKINLSYEGRRKSFKILKKEVDPNEKNIWFHVSSLGEFEIAKPIIETLKKSFDNIKIIVTFFSPSGYENSKEYRFADTKLYLPLDTSFNAKRFVSAVNPKIVIFIKNDIWSNYIHYLKENNSLIYSLSSKFNKSHFYFKFYGFWFLKQLKKIDFFYVQDNNSKKILEKNSFEKVHISGDSRYTSVINTLNKKSISYNGGDQLVINYEQIIPEFNLRNNHKSLNSNKLLNKPFQVRIFKDLEDPNYNQVFVMPILEYKNIYDGITLGGKLYNKSVLRKTFNYNLTPKYSVNSKTLTGSFNAYVMKYYEDSDLFKLFYGIYGLSLIHI